MLKPCTDSTRVQLTHEFEKEGLRVSFASAIVGISLNVVSEQARDSCCYSHLARHPEVRAFDRVDKRDLELTGVLLVP